MTAGWVQKKVLENKTTVPGLNNYVLWVQEYINWNRKKKYLTPKKATIWKLKALDNSNF